MRTRDRSRARVGSLTNLRSSYLGGACMERAVREDSAPLDPTERINDPGQKLQPGPRLAEPGAAALVAAPPGRFITCRDRRRRTGSRAV